jgi:hypothetical protein
MRRNTLLAVDAVGSKRSLARFAPAPFGLDMDVRMGSATCFPTGNGAGAPLARCHR